MIKKISNCFIICASFLFMSFSLYAYQNNLGQDDNNDYAFFLTDKIKEYENKTFDPSLKINQPVHIQFKLFNKNEMLEEGSLTIDEDHKQGIYSNISKDIENPSSGKETGINAAITQTEDVSNNEIFVNLNLDYVSEYPNMDNELDIKNIMSAIHIDNNLSISFAEPLFIPIINDYVLVLSTNGDFGDLSKFRSEFNLIKPSDALSEMPLKKSATVDAYVVPRGDICKGGKEYIFGKNTGVLLNNASNYVSYRYEINLKATSVSTFYAGVTIQLKPGQKVSFSDQPYVIAQYQQSGISITASSETNAYGGSDRAYDKGTKTLKIVDCE